MSETETSLIRQDINKGIRYGASHLILLIVCFLLCVSGVYLYDSRRSDQADARATLAEVKAKITGDQNATFQAQTQQQIQALEQQNESLRGQIGTLAATIQARNSQLATREAEINNLAPEQLAAQWGTVAQEPAPAVDSQGHLLASLPLAQKSLAAMEAEKSLLADRQDLTSELQNQQKISDNNAAELAKEKSAHLSDQNACTADKAALQADIAKIKANARKSKFRWALGGFASGLIAGIVHFI
jgi:septal ring factor EnvC (AmiA/AmiB activator)